MVIGSVVPWGERYEQKRQAERRAANKSAPLTKTLLCYLAGHREKGSAHTTMIALMFLVKNIVRVDFGSSSSVKHI